jgi:alkanesulfonate monooxygenase SsuD/methylene tetrahydromethanopterin reductase-like flavin-dependent oxidoreductase (luciferase family)
VQRGALASNLVGTPERCRAELEALAAAYETDEILVATWMDHPEERADLYRTLARELRLR